MNIKPEWFKQSIIEGLQGLMILRLRGTPAADTVTAVASVWISALSSRPIAWDEAQDRDRINKAFVELAATATHWPSPSEFLAILPPRKPQNALPPPSDRDMSPQTRKMVNDLLERMRANFSALPAKRFPTFALSAVSVDTLRDPAHPVNTSLWSATEGIGGRSGKGNTLRRKRGGRASGSIFKSHSRQTDEA